MKVNLSSSLVIQYVIASIVNLGSLNTGMSIVWSSPIIVKLLNGTDTPLLRPITQEEGSWIVSGGFLAAIVTNLLAGFIINKIGRKNSIILVIVPRICVSIWIIFVTEVWMLIFCRAVMVLTDCYIFVVVPVYVSEIASKEHRGSLGTFLHTLSCIGNVITFAVGPFISYTALNVIISTMVIVSSLPLPFLPETPVYLHSRGKEGITIKNVIAGRIDDAVKVLSLIRDSDKIKQELEDYKLSEKISVDLFALYRNKTFLKSLSLGILISGGANVIGFNAVSFYMQTILESTQTNLKPQIASVIIGCIQLSAAICTSFFTKMFGRRPMLMYSIAGMFFGMIGLGIFFKIRTIEGYVTSDGFMNYLPIVSLVLCTYSYNVGIGCLMFVIPVELFDGSARAFGHSVCIMTSLLLTFLTSKYLAEMTVTLGPSETYWFFSAMCILVGGLIYFFLPETKEKTFYEIQVALGNKDINTKKEEDENQNC